MRVNKAMLLLHYEHRMAGGRWRRKKSLECINIHSKGAFRSLTALERQFMNFHAEWGRSERVKREASGSSFWSLFATAGRLDSDLPGVGLQWGVESAWHPRCESRLVPGLLSQHVRTRKRRTSSGWKSFHHVGSSYECRVVSQVKRSRSLVWLVDSKQRSAMNLH